MKRPVYIYCGEDGEAGRRKAETIRDGSTTIILCSANHFSGAEIGDPEVIVMPDVSAWRRRDILAAYGREEIAPAEPIAVDFISSRPRGRPRKIHL